MKKKSRKPSARAEPNEPRAPCDACGRPLELSHRHGGLQETEALAKVGRRCRLCGRLMDLHSLGHPEEGSMYEERSRAFLRQS